MSYFSEIVLLDPKEQLLIHWGFGNASCFEIGEDSHQGASVFEASPHVHLDFWARHCQVSIDDFVDLAFFMVDVSDDGRRLNPSLNKVLLLKLMEFLVNDCVNHLVPVNQRSLFHLIFSKSPFLLVER